MSTGIVANGQIDQPELLRPLILKHAQIIAVDGGLLHCQKMGITPHLIVGDLDSCPPDLLNSYRSLPQILKTDQNETDVEFALKYATFPDITLYGAWGYRIDHSLTNALLLIRHPNLRLETETEVVFAIRSKVQFSCQVGQTLSLIPLNGPVKGIHTDGLKWELNQGTLDQNFIGISNVCLKPQITISVKEGSLLCIKAESREPHCQTTLLKNARPVQYEP